MKYSADWIKSESEKERKEEKNYSVSKISHRIGFVLQINKLRCYWMKSEKYKYFFICHYPFLFHYFTSCFISLLTIKYCRLVINWYRDGNIMVSDFFNIHFYYKRIRWKLKVSSEYSNFSNETPLSISKNVQEQRNIISKSEFLDLSSEIS